MGWSLVTISRILSTIDCSSSAGRAYIYIKVNRVIILDFIVSINPLPSVLSLLSNQNKSHHFSLFLAVLVNNIFHSTPVLSKCIFATKG